MDFEEILTSIGDYGVYQKKLLYLVLLPYFLMLPWAHSSTIFMVATPKHCCKVPELKNYSLDLQFYLTNPTTIDEPEASKCTMIDTNYTKLINELNLASLNQSDLGKIKSRIKNHYANQKFNYKKCDQGYLYDKKDYDETAVTSFDLVCGKEHLTDHILSMCGLGSVLGTPLFGAMSDKLGRKKTIIIINILFIISTFSPTLIKGYYAFLISRFFKSSVINTLFQIPFILLTELVSTDQRTMLGFAASVGWGIGICILPGLVYYFRNWVYLNHIITLTGVVYLFNYFYIKESPRWLIATHQIEEAEKVLKEIAIENKIPNAEKTIFIQKLELVGRKGSSSKNEDSSLTLIKNKQIRKLFFNITLGFFANAVAYNAINLNTFSLSGNQFLNYFLLSVIEIPASFFAFYIMDTRLGRRWTGSLFLLIFAFLNLVSIAIDDFSIKISLNIIGKCLISISFTAIYQISVEAYPTSLRNQGLSLSGTISSLQSIILPHFIKRNQSSDNFMTLSIITIVCFISGFALTFIPETLHEKLPQSIFDAETFGIEAKYWSLAKKKEVKNLKNDKDKSTNENSNEDYKMTVNSIKIDK